MKYGKLVGKILLGSVIWFVSSVLLMNGFGSLFENFSYFATQIGFVIATFVLFFWFDRKDGWKLGWKDPNWIMNGLKGAVTALIIPLSAILPMISMDLVSFKMNEWQLSVFAVQCLLFLTVSVGEETFFRGYLFGVIKHSIGTRAAVLIPTVLFAAIHLINPDGFSKPVVHIIIEMTNIFLIGLLLAQSRLHTGSLWAPIGLHFLINFIQSSIFGFLNGGKEVESLLEITFTELSILNGAGYGLESSMILTIILLAAMPLLHFFYKNKNKKVTISA